MNEPNSTPEARRARGRGFPTVPLDEAADIVRTAGKYGHGHAEAAFASYMGHQTTNSGAFKQRFAAMRSWGLVTLDQGQVVLTDLGRRVAHPLSDEDAASALQDAFMHAAVFGELYSASAKGQELETVRLANQAVHQLGISPKSTVKFAQCFARSAIAAGLATEVAAGKLQLKPLDDGSHTPPDDHTRTSAPPVVAPRATAASAAPPVIHQVWPARGGAVSFEIRLDRPLPAQAFAELAGIFESVERLVGQLSESRQDLSAAGE